MQNNDKPLREIKVIFNGTCAIPRYLELQHRDKHNRDIGVNIHYDHVFDCINQAYIPQLDIQTRILKLSIHIRKLNERIRKLKIIVKSKETITAAKKRAKKEIASLTKTLNMRTAESEQLKKKHTQQ